jgi:hypothetical protein
MSAKGELSWIDEVVERYRKTLTFQELRKGVVALSRIYVENRRGIERGAVFDGAGKRAAFACFYGPLHFLLLREVVRALAITELAPGRIVDLGCGTGVGGAALASLVGGSPAVIGYERNAWACGEARWLLRELGIRGRVVQKPLESASLRPGDLALLAFSVNELDPKSRATLLGTLLAAAKRDVVLLVVEPIAGRPTPWWQEWRERFLTLGGRDDRWRFEVPLPETLAALDRAAGLVHRELTARTLFLR